VLGKVTATGLYGPYDDTASDGTQTATHLLFSNVRVTRQDGSNAPRSAAPASSTGSSTPPSSRSPASPAIDANGQADLKLIHFDRRLTAG
jgi:hypothetical protein